MIPGDILVGLDEEYPPPAQPHATSCFGQVHKPISSYFLYLLTLRGESLSEKVETLGTHWESDQRIHV